jgi:hypothetical protein
MNNTLKILCLLIFSLISGVSVAKNKIDKKEFYKIVDYVNCALTKTYISGLTDPSDQMNYKEIEDKLESNSLEQPISYKILSELCNEYNFKKTLTELSLKIHENKVKYKEESTDQQLLTMIFDLSGLADGLKDSLDQEANMLKQEVISTYKIGDGSGNSNEDRESGKTKEVDKSILLIPLLVSFILFIVVIFYFNKELNGLKGRSLPRTEVNRIEMHIEDYRNSKWQMEKAIGDLRYMIDEISNKTIPGLVQKLTDLEASKQNSTHTEFIDHKISEEITQESKPNIFFMSTPNEDGSFLESRKELKPVLSVTLYRFEFENKVMNRAKFTIDGDHAAISDALSSPYKYLEPVCQIENPGYTNAKNIATLVHGIANLQGDKWVVSPDHKAIIKLI